MDNKKFKYDVIIKSRIDTKTDNEVHAINIAKSFINAYDFINDDNDNENIITKLYYIVPKLGKIFILITEKDMKELGIKSQILDTISIKDFSYIKFPPKIILYKELIIKATDEYSKYSLEDIKNFTQVIVNDMSEKTFPYKIPILKVIDYNTSKTFIILPSIFGDNVFKTDENIEVFTDGDIEKGKILLENF